MSFSHPEHHCVLLDQRWRGRRSPGAEGEDEIQAGSEIRVMDWWELEKQSPVGFREGDWGADSVMSDSLRPQDCSPPSSSVHGILGARIPEDLPNPGIKPESPASPALAGGFYTTSAKHAQENQ